MSDMADMLHIHTRRPGIRSMAIHCECGWSESILAMKSSKKTFAAHQAAALSAAGFGPVREARAEALEQAADAWGYAAAAVWLRTRARTIREDT